MCVILTELVISFTIFELKTVRKKTIVKSVAKKSSQIMLRNK